MAPTFASSALSLVTLFWASWRKDWGLSRDGSGEVATWAPKVGKKWPKTPQYSLKGHYPPLGGVPGALVAPSGVPSALVVITASNRRASLSRMVPTSPSSKI